MNVNVLGVRPIEGLVGAEIPGDWVVVTKLDKPGTGASADLTGSFFSIGYIVERNSSDGKKERAFMKVIDISLAIERPELWPPGTPFMNRINSITDAASYEKALLEVCNSAKLDRIVKILGHGDLDPPPGMALPVPYIIFELADGDVRKIVKKTNSIDDAWKFKTLHDVCVGVQQLHRQEIAHQDLKPSNILMFDSDGGSAKIGDLGRASRRGVSAMHDGAPVAGACAYAPPEQAFGETLQAWEDRRSGCDVYHLGLLVCFLFAGVTPQHHYISKLEKALVPNTWGGMGGSSYAAALPAYAAIFAEFLQEVANDFPSWAREELVDIVKTTCNPDYNLRGDVSARRQTPRTRNPMDMEKYVTRFDRLAKKALIEARK